MSDDCEESEDAAKIDYTSTDAAASLTIKQEPGDRGDGGRCASRPMRLALPMMRIIKLKVISR